MLAKQLDEEALFHAARRIPAGDARDLFLEQACAGDSPLAERVRSLLEMHEQESEFAEAPQRRTVEFEPIAERASSRIGPYRLMEQIGEGGFGLVFVAEQQEPVKRKVALKVIKPGMDSKQVIARFEAEKQALALMDHPNIARVLDAGATESGRPYFVMELVRGIPITDYCDQNQLTPRERLDLFITVCHAIQHAHQKGVIHRDIKPSNVLVGSHDGKPMAKVIDFGVAKAISQDLTQHTLYTNFAQMIGTPLYMSPEQAEMSGLDIDTRSDIYSLGVLLYELLTGSTPLEKKRFAQVAYDEIRRLIREEPPKPSQRLSTSATLPSLAACRKTEPAKLSKLIRGDLDWITMKALEKDRTRRYETANGLARDIERYLHDEPVEACPPSASYRIRKFARKNRVALTTAAAIALLIVIGASAATWQAVRAELARRDAETARAAEAEQRRRAEANERKAVAAAEAEKAAKAQEERRLNQIAKSNAVLTSVFDDLNIEKVKAGTEPLEAVLAKRLVLAAKQLERESVGDPLLVDGLQTKLGVTLLSLGFAMQAILLFEKARNRQSSQLGPDHPDTLTSMASLADAYQGVGQLDKALPLYKKTLKLRTATLGADHPDTLSSMHNLASGYRDAAKLDKALSLLVETLKLRTAKLGPQHPDTLNSMNNLASLYQAAGKLDLALPLLVETLKLRTTKLGPDHPDTLISMNNLAMGYKAAGQLDKSLPLLEQTLRLRMAKLGPDHPDTLGTMGNLGDAYSQAKQGEQAASTLANFVAAKRKTFPKDSPRFAGLLAQVSLDLLKCGQFPAAQAMLRECLVIREQTQPDAWATYNTQSMLGGALLGQKQYADAEPLLLKGFEGMKQRQKTIPPQAKDLRLREAMKRLVQLYEAMDKKDEAAKWHKLLDETKPAETKGEKP